LRRRLPDICLDLYADDYLRQRQEHGKYSLSAYPLCLVQLDEQKQDLKDQSRGHAGDEHEQRLNDPF